jgi:NADPH-dependent ferric siderophore reductase
VTLKPNESSIELAERLGVMARVCEVIETTQISASVREVVLGGPAKVLTGVAGNDVMIQVENAAGRLVRRRYSVRAADHDLDQFTLWITTGHDGPGGAWSRHASPGDHVDVIGPRGKITLDEAADWHLFVGDSTGLAASYRLAQSIEVPGRAIFIVEIDHPNDALTADFDEGLGVTGIFVDRQGRERNDPAGLLSGLAAFAFAPGAGHAYLFGEFTTLKAVKSALLDRGLDEGAISVKAHWRTGRDNADHGEPDKTEPQESP